ncbi:sacsin-like [Amphiura filiformis]|uniref:sacsin-like n=1 Tax=Amphiura filiformis TaxID=82378 RepID=UPI003B20BB90
MSNSSNSSQFGLELPPICVYIKQILDEYPEGGQILKELLQNADDAGARKVIFLYDQTQHPTDHLCNDSLKKFNGPALYAYNDATFTDEDWTNIQKPQQSGKVDDPTKVGQFGLGFISIYHITDMPSVLSGENVGFFDPHETHFVRLDQEEGVVDKRGKWWRISNELLQSEFKGQFVPFFNQIFGCSEKNFQTGKYPGTIFRFPLRNEESRISSVLYDDARIADLFQSFQNDAEISLLFLKSVESVSVFEKKNDGNPNAKLLFNVEVSSDSRSPLQSERSEFIRKSKVMLRSDSTNETADTSRSHVQIKGLSQSHENTSTDYIIVNVLRRSTGLQLLLKDKDVNYLPWVGVAAKTTTVTEGRTFCFLPLPEGEQTNLPVHVHGYFGLGKNRRSIKWPDHDSEHDKLAIWNKQLVEDNLPVAYAEIYSKRSIPIYLQDKAIPINIFPNMESRFCSNECPVELTCTNAISATQLRRLYTSDVPSMLKDNLPPNWVNGTGVVIWKSGSRSQPLQMDWLKNLWTWLRCSAVSLDDLNNLPLIQLQETDGMVHLARLRQNTLIYNKDTRYSDSRKLLSNSICSFLESLGVVVFKEDLPECVVQHGDISTYIRPGNGEGVMYILENLGEAKDLPHEVAQASADLKDELASLLSTEIQSFPPKWLTIIRQLPIFKATNGGYVTSTECKYAVPSGLYGIPIQTKQLQTPFVILDHVTTGLCTALRIQTLSKYNLVKLHVLPQVDGHSVYSKEECDRLMTWVLEENTAFDNDVKNVRFLLTSSQTYSSPSELFVPDSKLLVKLFQDSPVFPTGIYATGRLLNQLKRMLKSESQVTTDELFDLAKEIEKTGDQSRSRAFLKTIRVTRVSSQRHSMGVRGVHATANVPASAPWYGTSQRLHKPNQVKLIEAAPLVGSVAPLLDLKEHDDAFSKFFGWNQNLTSACSVNDVATHLINLHRCTSSTRYMGPMVEQIYKYMADKCSYDTQHLETFRELLQAKSWVWHGSGFTTPDKVAFNSSIQLGNLKAPLFVVPPQLQDDEHKQVMTMLMKLGVKESFAAEDFLNILKNLQQSHNDMALSNTDMAVVLDIIKALTSYEDLTTIRDQILVPDVHGVLRPCAKLVYNGDTEYEDEDSTPDSFEGFMYKYDSITNHQARLLGIRTCRDIQHDQCSVDEGFEHPFGQREKLTTRLRGILSEYSHNPDVLKELLQNADDAGASEIHVVYDPRKHDGAKIAGESWRHIHSLPAICVYNDKPFTEEDIKGIQNVGVGGKISDTTTTGRFGIGFNAVYLLTDCPTFLTQNKKKLCVFDPHVKYVPRATMAKPGKLYTNDDRSGNRRFLETYPDMTQGYLQEFNEFDLEKGTMFRFPLRPHGTESEISDKCYGTDQVKDILVDFQKVAEEALLFLNNIAKISISEIDQRTGKLKLKYRVSANISPQDRAKRHELGTHLKEYKNVSIKEIPVINRVYTINMTDSNKKKESWMISQSIGLDQSAATTQEDCEAGEFMTKTYLPRGGVAACIHGGVSGKAFCFLPLHINTNLPVHVNGTFRLDHSRQNLKKGDKDPIHKWNKLLAMYVIGPAYAHLIVAAMRIFQKSMRLDEASQQFRCWKYDKLFPNMTSTYSMPHDIWKLVGISVLKYIDMKDLKVLPVIKNYNGKTSQFTVVWFSPKGRTGDPSNMTSGAFFDDLSKLDTFSSEGAKRVSSAFRIFLREIGFNLISCSESIGKSFKAEDVGVEAEFISPQCCAQYVKKTLTHGLPRRIDDTPFMNAYAFKIVVEYCLDGIGKVEDLQGLAFQLDGHGILDVFSTRDPKYLSFNHSLLPTLQGLFLDADVVALLYKWADNINKKEETKRAEDKAKESKERAGGKDTGKKGKQESEGRKGTSKQEGEVGNEREKESEGRKGKAKASKDEGGEVTAEEKKECSKMDLYQAGILKEFTIHELAKFMHTNFPPNWKNPPHHLQWLQLSRESLPQAYWLQSLWNYVYLLHNGDNPCDLQALADWPIIPTTSGYLVSLSMSKSVMFPDDFISSGRRLLGILQKLDCPVVDEKGITGPHYLTHSKSLSIKAILRRYLVGPNNRSEILELIKHMIEKEGKAIVPGKLNDDECDTLLQYFQEGDEKLSADEIQTIKRLPLFCLVKTGSRESIHTDCYTIEEDINQSATLELVESTASITFLKHNKHLEKLYEVLGIERITLPRIYMKFILPEMKRCCLNDKLRHAVFIRDEIIAQSSEEEKEQIYKDLSQVAFIEDQNGEVRSANSFFDPNNYFFSALLDPIQLLPQNFRADVWNQFLIDIGLKHSMTKDILIMLAKRIEEKANTCIHVGSEEINDLTSISFKLIEELQRNEDLLDEDTLMGISEIRFVPSVRIDPQNGITTTVEPSDFICFRESIPEAYKDLTWTVAPLIASSGVPKEIFALHSNKKPWKKIGEINIHKHLGIATVPDLKIVMKHVKLLCTQIKAAEQNTFEENGELDDQARLEYFQTIPTIMEYLENKLDGNETQIKEELQQTPICTVGDKRDKLVRANQLAEDIDKSSEDHLRPYLYRSPRHLGGFDNLLCVLGAEKEPTFLQLANVLEEIHDRCRDGPMNESEKRSAYAAVRNMLILFSKRGDNNQDDLGNDVILYLPTTENKLRPSSSLHYTDLDEIESVGKEQDIELVASVKAMFYDFEYSIPISVTNYSELIELLPTHLRPEKLVTQEKPLDTNIHCSGGTQCSILQQMKELVHSDDLQIILLRIIYHQTSKYPSEEKQQKIADLRKFDSFVCVQELKTAFFDSSGKRISDRSRSRDILLSSSGVDSQDFVIHIGHTDISEDTESGSIFFLPLAQSIDRICKLGLDQFHVCILKDILIASPIQRKRVLEAYKVPEYRHLISESPGSIIPEDVCRLLEHDISHRFQVGEMAAYQKSAHDDDNGDDDDDDVYFIYVKILESIPPADDRTEESKGVKNVGLFFGIFRRKKAGESKSHHWRYKIDIGGLEPIVVSADKLFKFRRSAEVPADQEHSDTAEATINSGIRSKLSRAIPLSYSDISTPDPVKANLWRRQAWEDFKTVKVIFESNCAASLAWQAFILHQAAEKALKAVIFQLHGTQTMSHNLYALVSDVNAHTAGAEHATKLRDPVRQLLQLGCDAIRPRYPQYSQTTGAVYEELPFNTSKALEVCESILEIADEILGNSD